MTRALITGISGFVGSHLAEFLLNHTGWQVYGTVYGQLDNIVHIRDRLVLYPAELSRLDVVKFILDDCRPQYIFHLVAQPFPALSRKDPWFTLENNIRAQVNVLEGVLQCGLDSRVLVVGSSEEYGQVLPDELPVNEGNPLRPQTPYAVSKVAQDYLGLQYYLSDRVSSVRVRPFNHVGPRQRLGFVAPDFAHQLAEIEAGRSAPVMSVGLLDVAKDFSDVRDIVRGYYLTITRGEPGEVYNLGSGHARSVRELLRTLIELSGLEVEVVQDPARLRRAESETVVADCGKLHRLTGWRTEIPFEDSMRDVLNYWREQARTGASDPTPLGLQDVAQGQRP